MLSIQIEQDLQGCDDPKQQMTRQGKLVFVDLAGRVTREGPIIDPILFCLVQAAKK